MISERTIRNLLRCAEAAKRHGEAARRLTPMVRALAAWHVEEEAR